MSSLSLPVWPPLSSSFPVLLHFIQCFISVCGRYLFNLPECNEWCFLTVSETIQKQLFLFLMTMHDLIYLCLQSHLEDCEFERVDCEYCSRGCKEKLLRGKATEHRDQCQFRPVRCRLCREEVSHNQLQVWIITVLFSCLRSFLVPIVKVGGK